MIQFSPYEPLPIFANMTQQDITSALQCVGAFYREFQKDEFILMEEDKVVFVGCILEGCVQMIREDVMGNKAVLITMREKELFGESFACGSNITASASFVAKEATKVLFLPFDRVMHSCQSACTHHQKLMVNMVTLIAEKNAALIARLDILSKKTLREKIVAYLSFQADYHKDKYFTIPLRRMELAEYLNVDRSSLTRELNCMKAEELIDFDKNTFRLLKKFFR